MRGNPNSPARLAKRGLLHAPSPGEKRCPFMAVEGYDNPEPVACLQAECPMWAAGTCAALVQT